MSGNYVLFDSGSVIQMYLHLYGKMYPSLLMYFGADEVTAKCKCFYSNTELVTLSELQFTVCRGIGSVVVGGELSLLQPEGFHNQISGQKITPMDHMAVNLKRREGIRERETLKRQRTGEE